MVANSKRFLDFFPWHGRMASILLLIAMIFNLIHYSIFHDSNYIFEFILAQLGFLPISVFLVTVVINKLLGRREKEALLKKLNMVIGSFFNEVGTELLRHFSGDITSKEPEKTLMIDQNWQNLDYQRARKNLSGFASKLTPSDIDWQKLRKFMMAEKFFLLTLLGNANLLEHESFTELLWAVFHLADELACRQDIANLPPTDYEHLIGDVNRVYVLLLSEWLDHMQHLQEEYPFLFSLEVRTNPFNPEAHPEVD